MKHTPGPWEALLAIAERIDGTPYDVLSNGPDILIDLNCWLMDHQDIDPQQADAARAAGEALEALKDWLDDRDTLLPSSLALKVEDAIVKAIGAP